MLARAYPFPYFLRMSKLSTFLVSNLRFLMEERGLNPNSLAESVGKKPPQATIFRILNGESLTPRDDTLRPLADFFGVEVHELRYSDLSKPAESRVPHAAGELPGPSAPPYDALNIWDYKEPPSKLTTEREVFDVLAVDLQQYVDRPLKFGGMHSRVDYMSDNVVIELKRSRAHDIDSGLLQLATIRSILGEKDARSYVLILLTDDPSKGVQHAMIRGGLLGISVYMAQSASDAAHLIEKLERDATQSGA